MIRRQHRKSRKGCTPCKKRRVKCDEQTPCTNCVRRSEDCDLLYMIETIQDGLCANSTSLISSIRWSRQLYLMQHYVNRVARSLTTEKLWQDLMQITIPEIAMNHPSLTHGIIGFSALHLVYERPNERSEWIELALRHGMTASAQFRTLIPTANAHNCHALLALSILSCAHSLAFASYGMQLSPGQVLPIDDIIEPFNIIKGTNDLIQVNGKDFLGGPLMTILSHPGFVSLMFPSSRMSGRALPKAITEQFHRLREMIEKMCSKKDEHEVLLVALDSLETIYVQVLHISREDLAKNPGIIFQFVGMVGSGFVSMLRQGHGGSLVIYAHFALIADVMNGRAFWYLDGWSVRAMQSICARIDDAWKEWLWWPEQQIGKMSELLQPNNSRGCSNAFMCQVSGPSSVFDEELPAEPLD